MKRRKSRAPRAPQNPRGSASQASAAPARTRRDLLRSLRTGAIAVAVVSGAGWFAVGEVRATACEHDLSRIGNGIATVVQVHDPQCPSCVALQREARDALDAVPQDQIQYLIANLRTDEGRAFARRHGVSRVTLVLLDGDGRRRDILVGPNTAPTLERVFSRHVRRSNSG